VSEHHVRPSESGAGGCGLLVDFGGVLTTNIWDSFRQFCEAEGLDPDAVKKLFRDEPDAVALLRRLEKGELDESQFAKPFSGLLGLPPARHSGLVARLFCGLQPVPEMIEALPRARAAGVKTGLISNSWGSGLYDRSQFPRLFDVVVISGEEGLHKPQPEIFELGTQRLGIPPARCVFVDDLRENCEGAEAVGMTAVLHRDVDSTLERLEALLGVALRC
jgi:putative hydrolase of the HAD superfamily